MSKFTPSITRTYEYEGDTVTIVMNRLKRKDAVKMMPFFGEPDENGNYKMSVQQQMVLLDNCADIIRKNVVSITGMSFDEAVNDVIAVVFDEAYFLELLSDILNDMIEASFTKAEHVKKSVPKPDDTLKASQTLKMESTMAFPSEDGLTPSQTVTPSTVTDQ